MNDEATEDQADDLLWTKRASALKRAFWWSGLTLLSAAPLSFLDRDEVLSFFAVFPVPLNALETGPGHEGPTSPLQVLEESRSWSDSSFGASAQCSALPSSCPGTPQRW